MPGCRFQGYSFTKALLPGRRRAPRFVLAAVGATLVVAQVPVSAQEAPAQHPAFVACLGFDRAACASVLADQPGNLTARFLRGLASELAGDSDAAFVDFDQVVAQEPRHFGAQLWRYLTAAGSVTPPPAAALRAYLDGARLGAWPMALGQHYLGEVDAEALLDLAAMQPAAARAEALCAAHYHAGRAALLAGERDAARRHFAAARATGARHVFEYLAAERALRELP